VDVNNGVAIARDAVSD